MFVNVYWVFRVSWKTQIETGSKGMLNLFMTDRGKIIIPSCS